MMDAKPLVSILIPYRNQAEHLSDAIDSALTQSWMHIEVLVLIGGASENIQTVIKPKQLQDQRIKWFTFDNNASFVPVQKVLTLCRGALISWLNPEQRYADNAIQQAVQSLLNNPNWLMVHGESQSSIFCKRALYLLIGKLNPESGISHYQDYINRAFEIFPERICLIAQDEVFLPSFSQDNNQLNVWFDDLKNRGFTQAISVGNFCHAAQVLKLAGLRKFAGPFDWIFSNIEMVTHCFEDDFQTFLDLSQYRNVPEDQRELSEANVCQHEFYRQNYGIEFMFNHHSPLNERDYAYLQRCVERFRITVKGDTPTLLLMLTVESIDEQRLKPLVNMLRSYTKNCYLLVIKLAVELPHANALTNKISLQQSDNDWAVINFSTHSTSNGVEFFEQIDNLRLTHFIRQIGCHNSFSSLNDRWDIKETNSQNYLVITEDNFDEDWYRAKHPDIAVAIDKGIFESGWKHFQSHGKDEGRSVRKSDLIAIEASHD